MVFSNRRFNPTYQGLNSPKTGLKPADKALNRTLHDTETRMKRNKFSEDTFRFGMFRDTTIAAATRNLELNELREMRASAETERRRRYVERRQRHASMIITKRFLRLVRKLRQKEREKSQSKRYASAAFIQQFWRLYREYQRERARDLVRFSALTLQCFIRRMLARKRLRQRYGNRLLRMVMRIQGVARRYIASQTVRKLRVIREFCVIEIQRVIRGKLGRNLAVAKSITRGFKYIEAWIRSRSAALFFFQLVLVAKEENARRTEEARMVEEDEIAQNLEGGERERKKMIQREQEAKELEKKRTIDLAKKHGIILLPWRQKYGTNLKALVHEQQKQKQKQERRLITFQKSHSDSTIAVEEGAARKLAKKEHDAEHYRKVLLKRIRKRHRLQRESEFGLHLCPDPEYEDSKTGREDDEMKSHRSRRSVRSGSSFRSAASHKSAGSLLTSATSLSREQIMTWIKDRRKLDREKQEQQLAHDQQKQLSKQSFLRKLDAHRKKQLAQFVQERQVLNERRQQQRLEQLQQERLLQHLADEKRSQDEALLKRKLRAQVRRSKRIEAEQQRCMQQEAIESERQRKKELRRKARALRQKIVKQLQEDARKQKQFVKRPAANNRTRQQLHATGPSVKKFPQIKAVQNPAANNLQRVTVPRGLQDVTRGGKRTGTESKQAESQSCGTENFYQEINKSSLELQHYSNSFEDFS